MSGFDKLMGELASLAGKAQDDLVKALPPADGDGDDSNPEKKIVAAAADGGVDTGAVGDADADKKKDGDDGKPMTKSLTLADGSTIEVEDGAELIKALTTRLESTESTFAKALESLTAIITGRDTVIKSLSESVAKLSNQGRGRKAVVDLIQKPAETVLAKSTPEGVNADEFFAKAMEAQKAGRISGADISLAETLLNKGQQIPPALVQRVMQ